MSQINPFYSTKCTPAALDRMQLIREAYKKLADLLQSGKDEKSDNPDHNFEVGPREFALALTNLEQSAMWAIKSISHYNPEQ